MISHANPEKAQEKLSLKKSIDNGGLDGRTNRTKHLIEVYIVYERIHVDSIINTSNSRHLQRSFAFLRLNVCNFKICTRSICNGWAYLQILHVYTVPTQLNGVGVLYYSRWCIIMYATKCHREQTAEPRSADFGRRSRWKGQSADTF